MLLLCGSLALVSMIYFMLVEKNSLKTYVKSTVYKEAYPVYAFKAFSAYLREMHSLDKNLLIADKFKYASVNQSKIKKTIFFVIGESTRKSNWSVYGYNREVIPKLRAEQNIIFFDDVIVSSNATIKSVPLFLTPVNAANHLDHSKYKSILQLFKEAGYKTYWISNQNDYGEANIRIHMKDADSVICSFGNKGITSELDEIVLPVINHLIDTTFNQFFIIHLNGTHYKYEERYPKRFAKFGNESVAENTNYFDPDAKQQLTDTYDNSNLYQDYILDSLISMVKSDHLSSLLLFVPDHGEDLFDDCRLLSGHGASFTKVTYNVPFFVYSNERFNHYFQKKKEIMEKNRTKKIIANEDAFYTLAELAEIQFKLQDFKKCFSTEQFIEQEKRIILLPDGNVSDYNTEIIKEKKLLERLCK